MWAFHEHPSLAESLAVAHCQISGVRDRCRPVPHMLIRGRAEVDGTNDDLGAHEKWSARPCTSSGPALRRLFYVMISNGALRRALLPPYALADVGDVASERPLFTLKYQNIRAIAASRAAYRTGTTSQSAAER
jgi:hypothetical protein